MLDQAREYCQASIRLAAEIPDYNIVASCLGLFAGIAAKQGRRRRAARLAGASAAMYARQKRNPWEDSSLDTLLPGWREGLEPDAIEEAYQAGQAMSTDEAVAMALADDTDARQPDD
jgi:hypothetical protein